MVHSLVSDPYNEKLWASVTFKKDSNRHSAIFRTDSSMIPLKYSESIDLATNTYSRADLLSYKTGGRVIGIGRYYSGNTLATSNMITVYIERDDSDVFFYKEIDTGRDR